MDDATGLAEALLGLNGFRVLAVEETPSEVIVMVETMLTSWAARAAVCAPRPRTASGSTSGTFPASGGRHVWSG
jgi:hypothetical protein